MNHESLTKMRWEQRLVIQFTKLKHDNKANCVITMTRPRALLIKTYLFAWHGLRAAYKGLTRGQGALARDTNVMRTSHKQVYIKRVLL